jgi:hypothetical protein
MAAPLLACPRCMKFEPIALDPPRTKGTATLGGSSLCRGVSVLDWDLMLAVHIEGEAVEGEPWPGIVEARTLAGPGLDPVRCQPRVSAASSGSPRHERSTRTNDRPVRRCCRASHRRR